MAGRKCTGSSTRRNRHGESCDELVKLEAELRKAYTLKTLQAQVAEKDANREIEEIREKFVEKMLINEIQDEMREAIKKSQKDKLNKCREYKNELEEQMQLKEEGKKKIEEEERRERRVMVEVDRIRDEEEESKKLKTKMELSERIMREYQIQEEIKEILKRKEEDFNKEEDVRNRKYLEVFEQRKLEEKKLREGQLREREEVINLVAGMIIDLESRKHEREALIADLVAEEIQCQVMIRERNEYVRRRKEKEELVAVLDEQVSFNEECKRRFVEQDRDFAEAVMMRILEDERLERSTLEARRRRTIKYREELERLMEEKRTLREKQIAQIQEELEAENLQDRIMRDRLKDQRISLLELHSGSVAEFINRSKLNEEEQKILAGYLKRKKY